MNKRGRKSKNDYNNIIDNVVQLKKEFKRTSGQTQFFHKQVYNKDGWYIYAVYTENSISHPFYEVFKEKIVNSIGYKDNKMYIKKDVNIVLYPSDESFGKWAWTYNSIKECMKKIST